MQTQASVKGVLAYSTIAQMGFMILQCGLGAYSAAIAPYPSPLLLKPTLFFRAAAVLQERARSGVL